MGGTHRCAPIIMILHLPRGEQVVPLLCRFLTVHAVFPDDSRYSGTLRVIVHDDPAKLARWRFVHVGSKTLLQVQDNRDPTGAGTANWYLTVLGASSGCKRDGVSSYLAVTRNIGEAMPVTCAAVPVATMAAMHV